MLERYFEKAEILTSKLMLELTSKNKRSNINSGKLITKKSSVSAVSSQLSTLSLDSLEFPINSVGNINILRISGFGPQKIGACGGHEPLLRLILKWLECFLLEVSANNKRK